MSGETVRVGVIGLGLMGLRHARVYAQLPGVRLVAVADVDQARLDEARRILPAEPYADFQELLARDDVDAVSICTPDEFHRAPAEAAASAGKHMLLEKPIATSLADGQAIVEACRRAGVLLTVGHLLRFDPRYRAVREAIAAGHLGTVTQVTAHRNSPWTMGPARYAPGTSLTMHVAVHDIDLAGWYIGGRPLTVYAQTLSRRLADRRMDDVAAAVVRYETGAIACFQYSWALPPTSVTQLDARIEVIGTKGMAIAGTYHGQGVFIATEATTSAPDVHHMPILDDWIGGDLREELLAFTRCVAQGRAPTVSGADALLAIAVATAVEESARVNAPVAVGPSPPAAQARS